MKHLKKDDGYVLVYVLIVFAILSFVAVSICTTALNNLKAQKADVARMEARYVAEGELQQFVAELAQIKSVENTETVQTDMATLIERSGRLNATAQNWHEEVAGEYDATNYVYVKASAVHEAETVSVLIETTLCIPVDIEPTTHLITGTEQVDYYSYSYQVIGADITYESYDISYEQKEVPDET